MVCTKRNRYRCNTHLQHLQQGRGEQYIAACAASLRQGQRRLLTRMLTYADVC